MTPSRIKFQSSRVPQLSLAFGIQLGYGKLNMDEINERLINGKERLGQTQMFVTRQCLSAIPDL
jgi:hypothetical protein